MVGVDMVSDSSSILSVHMQCCFVVLSFCSQPVSILVIVTDLLDQTVVS